MVHSDYLDLAIGLAVVFFLAGMLVSGLNEGVSWMTRVRAKFLWAYLYDLFNKDREQRALPRGRAGIVRLWGANNDKRPTAGGSMITVPASDLATADWLKRLAYALDPIYVPQLTKQGDKALTAIKSVPAASLAQAFLEVFADVGRQEMTRAVATILDRVATPSEVAKAIDRLVQRIDVGSSDLGTAFTAFQTTLIQLGFSSTQTVIDSRRDAADKLTAALIAAHGGKPDTRLRDVWRDAAEAWPRGLEEGQVRTVVDATARVFPASFARLRIEAALAKFDPKSPLAPTLNRLWEGASGEIDKFRSGVESYLDGELQRLSGYYRRSIRIVMFSFAFLVAILGGIDAISVGRNLWRNPEDRAALVQLADEVGASTTTTTTTTVPASGATTPAAVAPTSGSTVAGLQRIQAECADKNPPDEAKINTPAEAAAAYAVVRTCVGDALNQLTGVGVIDHALWIDPGAWWEDWANARFWLHAIGIVLTSLALMLGAPFWFDLIKRATGLRNAIGGET